MSDAGVGALMALAGVQGAIYNVRINLPNITEDSFVKEMRENLDSLLNEAKEICQAVQAEVEKSLG
jgi:formiminotetrahydrofolate cyclodeaminase